jgi:hypothetical protein
VFGGIHLKKKKEETGKLVEPEEEEPGPATLNNRIRKILRRKK